MTLPALGPGSLAGAGACISSSGTEISKRTARWVLTVQPSGHSWAAALCWASFVHEVGLPTYMLGKCSETWICFKSSRSLLSQGPSFCCCWIQCPSRKWFCWRSGLYRTTSIQLCLIILVISSDFRELWRIPRKAIIALVLDVATGWWDLPRYWVMWSSESGVSSFRQSRQGSWWVMNQSHVAVPLTGSPLWPREHSQGR